MQENKIKNPKKQNSLPQRHLPELKPAFLERMQEILQDKKDFQNYLDILKILPVRSIRCNTLKISPENLKKQLEAKAWKISQPWPNHKEVMIVESSLEPGELGRSLEHQLGYYYIQELASMLPAIALEINSGKEQIILDLCAAPGSKTTQIASYLNNTGTIIANEVSMGRLRILATNTERCGVTNLIITRKEGSAFCQRLAKYNPELKFSKILIDAPCSGEGTLRSSPKTYLMWNEKTIFQLSGLQKKLVASAIPLLEKNGELIYSTCTHAPEENEEIVNFILENFPEMQIQKIKLPVKTRQGLTTWKNKTFSKEVKLACRIYPQDSNTEGFFIAKFRKVGE
ncbi:RsmB/NOP family class I SAM-dependent RNA methyltransferase [Candidatus Pacearchaeota archaeon]|nr:RsmB/NOP family class I SAM-dependent RNA methyltransferase [Candidatus Pacearchaeota archaeon]